MTNQLDLDALAYHRQAPAGKLQIVATKPMATQRDLALAYSPGVAAACNEIVRDPVEASTVTARGNLVAVISNGTAVLGLGAIGPLASKPVMEGKAVLFKKFSGIDVFDIEVDETDVDRLVDIIAALEPTFGGINLEDIKAPECFEVERKLRERMNIPVFHDDQHGTAIVTAAAVLNGLRLVNKTIGEVQIVASGAGAAALACLDLLVSMGASKDKITVCDRSGVIYEGRGKLDKYKSRYARQTEQRTLNDAIDGADIFLGLSGPGSLTQEMVKKMAKDPLILAMANPDPEIRPEDAKEVRPDAILATGRSDYPNQVNNVLCFPFIFRGALDVSATEINEHMKLACVKAIADLAMAEPSDLVQKAYLDQSLRFGPEYLIPKPFDPRLIVEVSSAVAKAAMESGVAKRPIEDMKAYRRELGQFVFRTGSLMKPIFERAKAESQRLVYAEGESRRVLQAVQQVVDEGIAQPILVGRPEVIAMRLDELGLRIKPERDFEVVDPSSDPRYRSYWGLYHEIMGRRGISPNDARTIVRTKTTVIAGLMLRHGDADAMLCGIEGRFRSHLRHVDEVVGRAEGIHDLSTLSALVLPTGTFFVCDSHVTANPSAEEIAEMTLLSAMELRRFGIEPKVALLSHSNFGSHETESAAKMRKALRILRSRAPRLEVDGEMHADTALAEDIRQRVLPDSRLSGRANLLVMPNLDAAHITYATLKVLGGGVTIGPILIGTAMSAHVVTNSITVRGLVNMSALAVVAAAVRARETEETA
jgi:malate dehydrogenase (oxaloacetate-decarboxylating)(NADP+)